MANVDPRFDPRFQRGYDGPSLPPPTALAPPASPAPAPRIEPLPTSGEIIEPPPAEAPVEFVDEPPRRNPFEIALLVVSLAFILVGVAVVWSSASNNGFSGADAIDPWQQLLSQLRYTLQEPLLIGGVVGVILWLGLRAIEKVRSSDAS